MTTYTHDNGIIVGGTNSPAEIAIWSALADGPGDRQYIHPPQAAAIHARTSAPKMRAALEAVLALHESVAVYAQADECECGNEDHTIIESEQGDDLCWDTPTGEQRCAECLDEDSGYIDYPCPTVVLIREALT